MDLPKRRPDHTETTKHGELKVWINTRAQQFFVESDDWRAKAEQLQGDQTITIERENQGESREMKVVVGARSLESTLKQHLLPLVEMEWERFKEISEEEDIHFEHGGTNWKKKKR